MDCNRTQWPVSDQVCVLAQIMSCGKTFPVFIRVSSPCFFPIKFATCHCVFKFILFHICSATKISEHSQVSPNWWIWHINGLTSRPHKMLYYPPPNNHMFAQSAINIVPANTNTTSHAPTNWGQLITVMFALLFLMTDWRALIKKYLIRYVALELRMILSASLLMDSHQVNK